MALTAAGRFSLAAKGKIVRTFKPLAAVGELLWHGGVSALGGLRTAIARSLAADHAVSLFTTLGLTSEETAAVDAGRPVAKVLPWGGPSEVYVFGAVHVDGSAETYLKAARDVQRLSGTPGYLGIGELRDGATVADLSALAFEPDDVKALKSCREGSCDVQLPTGSIQAFHDGVDFSRPDAAEQANALARPIVLRLLRSYQQGGHHALGEYQDKQNPARVADQFETMIGRLRFRIVGIVRYRLARQIGLKTRINTIMQTCFFAITGVLPVETAIAKIKETIEDTYGKKGGDVLKRNFEAVDQALAALSSVPEQTRVTSPRRRPPRSPPRRPPGPRPAPGVP